MSERGRMKALHAVERLTGPGATVTNYVPARTGPDPTRTIVYLIGAAVGGSTVIALLTGVIVIPGVLLMLVVYYGVNGPRGIALVDGGLVLLTRSFWTDKPNKILTSLSHQALTAVSGCNGARVRLDLGIEQVWVSRTDYEDILIAAGLALPHAAVNRP